MCVTSLWHMMVRKKERKDSNLESQAVILMNFTGSLEKIESECKTATCAKHVCSNPKQLSHNTTTARVEATYPVCEQRRLSMDAHQRSADDQSIVIRFKHHKN